MKELATKALGTIEVSPQQIIDFPDGLFGFQEQKSFALVEESADSPFKWLQSVNDSDLAFVIIQPDLFLKSKYIPGVSATDLQSLHLYDIKESLIFVIVTIPENNPSKMTANLQGPILINPKERIARQVISSNEKHVLRYPILENMES